jgi:hypothetical protein
VLEKSVIPVIHEDDNHHSAYNASLEEQVLRLQSLVGYLLEKNEQLRRSTTAKCKNVEKS